MVKSKVRKTFDMTPLRWERVNSFRFAERLNSEAAAINALIDRGLDAWEAEQKKGDPPEGEPRGS